MTWWPDLKWPGSEILTCAEKMYEQVYAVFEIKPEGGGVKTTPSMTRVRQVGMGHTSNIAWQLTRNRQMHKHTPHSNFHSSIQFNFSFIHSFIHSLIDSIHSFKKFNSIHSKIPMPGNYFFFIWDMRTWITQYDPYEASFTTFKSSKKTVKCFYCITRLIIP